MRVLYLCATFPYPPKSGIDHRSFYIPWKLSDRIDQRIVCRAREPVATDVLAAFEARQLQADVIVEPRPGLATKIIKVLRSLIHGHPLRMGGYHFESIERRLARRLVDDDPDLVVVGGAWMGAYWPVIRASNALSIIDLANLEGERLHRLSLFQRRLERVITRIDTSRIAAIETKLVHDVDSVFVTSERERTIVREDNPRARVKTVPNGVDCDAVTRLPPQEGREVLFVGALDYFPNVDGVIHFVRSVFPILRKRISGVSFRIVGRSPLKAVLELNDVEGVVVTGEVDTLETYYRDCAACVVPLRTGGGTRLKILEAMAYGRPVVSTKLGCEGLDVEHLEHLMIADSPGEIADAIARLLTRRSLAGDLVERSRKLCEDRYSWSGIADRVHEEYNALLARDGGRRRGQSTVQRA